MWAQKDHFQPIWENKGTYSFEELKINFNIKSGVFFGSTATFVFRWVVGKKFQLRVEVYFYSGDTWDFVIHTSWCFTGRWVRAGALELGLVLTPSFNIY
jgi:hypothetical protein